MTALRRRAPLLFGLMLMAPLAVGTTGVAAPKPAPTPAARDADHIKQSRDRIRGRSEWRQLRRATAEAPPEDPSEGCDKGEPRKRRRTETSSGCAGCGGVGQAFSGLTFVMAGLAIALLVGLILWAIVKVVGKSDDDDDDADFGDPVEELMPATPPGEKPASVYLQRARELAAQGDHRGAIRQLLLGCMAWTERKNLIRFRKGLTNRDYLRALFRRPSQHRGMLGVVDQFEKIYYGRRTATTERFERVLPDYLHGFEGDEDRRLGTAETPIQG